jgi:uncharacterized damage-inducible protein DinB
MSIASQLVADLESEAEHTRTMLALVPDAKLSWRPHPKSMSVGELASHLAETPSWLPGFLAPEFDLASMGDYKPWVGASRAAIQAEYDKHHRALVAELARRDDRFLQETWSLKNAGKLLEQKPRAAALREMLVHHAIHHRGQLSVCYRLLGIALPPIYGPTADAPALG